MSQSSGTNHVTPGLERLVVAVEDILGGGGGGGALPPPGNVLAEVRQVLADALDDPRLLPPGLTEHPVLPRSGVGKYLLHRSPAFVLFASVTAPHAVIPAHDHGSWGLVGLHRGVEEEIQYIATELGSGQGLVGLAETHRRVHSRGAITAINPPAPDIHVIVNRCDHNSIGIHLFGHDVVANGFCGYVPAHLRVETGPLDYDEIPSPIPS